MNVAPRRSGTRARKRVGEDLQIGDSRQHGPSPAKGPPGSALAAKLVEEELGNTIDDPVVVRLSEPPQSVQGEGYDPSLVDGDAQELIRPSRRPTHLGPREV
jgi:hypothetical protein